MPRVSSHFALQDPRQTTTDIVVCTPASVPQDANRTLTTDQVLSGWIMRSGATAARTDTLPTAAQLCEAISGVAPNTQIDVRVRNTSGQTITLAAGKGGTMVAGNTATVATVSERTFRVLITNVTPGLEAYSVYNLGGGTY